MAREGLNDSERGRKNSYRTLVLCSCHREREELLHQGGGGEGEEWMTHRARLLQNVDASVPAPGAKRKENRTLELFIVVYNGGRLSAGPLIVPIEKKTTL